MDVQNSMKPLLIIKMGQALPPLAERRGDFEDWIILSLKNQDLPIAIVSPYLGEPLPRPEHFSGIIITGSYAMVTDRETWSEQTAAWIPRAIESRIPLLGICYGHQLLAHAVGGVVGNCPTGVEVGTVRVTLTEAADKDPLFKGLPKHIKAHASHTQTVIQLPVDAVLLAFGKNEPHHAFALGPCAWGVQFHPEFDADIMKTDVHECAELINTHGQDPDNVIKDITETPYSQLLLKRFADIAISRQTVGNP